MLLKSRMLAGSNQTIFKWYCISLKSGPQLHCKFDMKTLFNAATIQRQYQKRSMNMWFQQWAHAPICIGLYIIMNNVHTLLLTHVARFWGKYRMNWLKYMYVAGFWGNMVLSNTLQCFVITYSGSYTFLNTLVKSNGFHLNRSASSNVITWM